MSFIVVVPARYGSSRLPGKPLADIAGLPMVMHVVNRCLESAAGQVCVATDHDDVFKQVESMGAKVVMTAASHPSGTDRIEEVTQQLQLDDNDIVVNVQGDEPLIPAAVINQVAKNLADNPDCSIATLCEPVTDRQSLFNPNIVKVVMDNHGRALYFSRAPIAWHRDAFSSDAADSDDSLPEGNWWRHIGIYAYRVGFLKRYVRWQPAQLEQMESLEQLRALANGENIHVAESCEPVPGGVDTPDDLERMRKLLGAD